jgi:4-hydroxythreonine-4-phosphate dehydrogenase
VTGSAPGHPVRLAVTAGDPRGIGPEVVRAAVPAALAQDAHLSFVILAPEGVEAPPGIEVVRVPGWDGTEAGAGRASVEAIRRGVELALAGRVHGLVTGPVHKPALHAAGFDVPGQTELLRDLTGAPAVGMLMAAERTRLGPPLRILLATTHLALRDVPDRVTSSLLVEQTALLDRALREGWGFPRPRLALCALNPHASDGGLFGDEEARVMAPALLELREAGILVEGPLPADTVFRRALDGALDAVVAPYHDVGMAAFKTVAFGSGVNVTLGLPFPRTSPDHGTAFDRAGKGTADPSSTGEAIRLATRIARSRFDMVHAPG